MVTLYVGPKRKEFIVHRNFICHSAKFFKKAFTGNFKEANGEMHMPDDDPGAVSLYIDWLYRSSIPIVTTEIHLHKLYELYFFADKLCLMELKDKTMDTIQDMAKEFDLMDELIKPELVTKVMTNTPMKNEGLRHFCIYHMVFVFLRRWGDGGGDTESENEYEDDDHDDDLTYPCVTRNDVKTVQHICTNTNNFYFLNYFLLRLTRQVHDGIGSSVDPRDRDEGMSYDRC
jgi:BTB/POZ domain